MADAQRVGTAMEGERREQVYLVTGGAGFLGAHLVKMLVERGVGIREVRVFDQIARTELESLSTDRVTVTMVQGDVTDLEQVCRVSQGVDVVIHSASVIDVSGRYPQQTIERVNIQGTRNVIEACIRDGVTACVYTSSTEVVGPNTRGNHLLRGDEDSPYETVHSIPYSRAKAVAENLILEANGIQVAGGKRLSTCALRPMGIYGEGCPLLVSMYHQARRLGGHLFRLAPSTVQIGHVYVGNVAWMHIMAARALTDKTGSLAGQVYYCTDASPDRSHMDFNMELLGPCGVKLVGRAAPVLPWGLVYCLACLLELLGWLLRPFVNFCPLLNRYTLAMVSVTFTVQTDKAERHFHYRPLYSWEEARDRTVRWLRSLDQRAPRPGGGGGVGGAGARDRGRDQG